MICDTVWIVWHKKVVEDVVYRVIMDLTALGNPCFKYELNAKKGEFDERELFATEEEARRELEGD